MSYFIPLSIPNLTTPSVFNSTTWNLLDSNESLFKVVDTRLKIASSESLAYEVSYVSCTHPEGKSWESIYIPLDAGGVAGVSITWWNRSAGLKGSINVKRCSHRDFYDTVASKAVYKGYEVVAYVGSDKGFTRRHAFVETLASRSQSSSPCLAMSMTDHSYISGVVSAEEYRKLVGRGLAESIAQHPATSNFFKRMQDKGFSTYIQSELPFVSGSPGEAFIHSISEFMKLGPAPEYKPADKVVQEVDKVEKYDTWGSFG